MEAENRGKDFDENTEGKSNVSHEQDVDSNIIENLSKTTLSDLKEKCPAFKDACPFEREKDIGSDEMASKAECVFKDSRDLSDLYSKVGELMKQPGEVEQMSEILNDIHKVSSNLKESLGECPVFKAKEGCPFKTLCTDGTALIEKLKTYEWMKFTSTDDKTAEISKEKTLDEKPVIPLAAELKEGTKKVHRAIENIHFVRDLVKGRVGLNIYLHFVGDLFFLYRALETATEEHKDHDLLKQLYFPKALHRLDTLKQDLRYFYGDNWEDEIQISQATQEYVDRLEEVSKNDPKLLISHCYSRYLGDLSGGQLLKKIAQKAYDLPENGDGIKFYEFEEITDTKEFKEMYHQRLDNMNVSRSIADELVEEAKKSFLLHVNLFRELDVLSGYEENFDDERVEDVGEKVPHPTKILGEQSCKNEDGNQINWVWIIAVASLIFAILMGFLTKVVA